MGPVFNRLLSRRNFASSPPQSICAPSECRSDSRVYLSYREGLAIVTHLSESKHRFSFALAIFSLLCLWAFGARDQQRVNFNSNIFLILGLMGVVWIPFLALLLFGPSTAQDQWDDRFREFSAGKDGN